MSVYRRPPPKTYSWQLSPWWSGATIFYETFFTTAVLLASIATFLGGIIPGLIAIGLLSALLISILSVVFVGQPLPPFYELREDRE